ncbi:hypothetical protein BS50DRAFT_33997 [Corynespora cassiicola Philippines]|uniref:Uncharacterized protein n=1 Tax=Corynespora cassiicola Philippines TaxID=1448308 RepID=A0A2T2PC07_CORCC|nr:hypothetical protein BS50DRAFT_33997 [Corynespora cassiicola Philippines]
MLMVAALEDKNDRESWRKNRWRGTGRGRNGFPAEYQAVCKMLVRNDKKLEDASKQKKLEDRETHQSTPTAKKRRLINQIIEICYRHWVACSITKLVPEFGHSAFGFLFEYWMRKVGTHDAYYFLSKFDKLPTSVPELIDVMGLFEEEKNSRNILRKKQEGSPALLERHPDETFHFTAWLEKEIAKDKTGIIEWIGNRYLERSCGTQNASLREFLSWTYNLFPSTCAAFSAWLRVQFHAYTATTPNVQPAALDFGTWLHAQHALCGLQGWVPVPVMWCTNQMQANSEPLLCPRFNPGLLYKTRGTENMFILVVAGEAFDPLEPYEYEVREPELPSRKLVVPRVKVNVGEVVEWVFAEKEEVEEVGDEEEKDETRDAEMEFVEGVEKAAGNLLDTLNKVAVEWMRSSRNWRKNPGRLSLRERSD